MRERPFRTTVWLCLCLLMLAVAASSSPASQPQDPGISKAAADSCNAKIKALEAHAAGPQAKRQQIRITELEMNSYLALVLSASYHPSLKSIRLKFEEGRLQAVAKIAFDRLQFSSTQFINSLFRKMLSGVHTLTVRGILIADNGKGNFQLEEARFDSMTIPNPLVSEIITTVGKRQNPPFDPMQPSTLPYSIRKVETHQGYILIHTAP